MSAVALLRTLFSYQAWANDEVLAKIANLDAARYGQERETAIRLMSHCRVVNQIFAAHLAGTAHGFTVDNTTETPALEDLRETMATADRWYADYLETVTPAQLADSIPFVFTDGDRGCMSREEMLMHVITHGGYHRGEAGSIIGQLSAYPLWDTLAVYLHRAEPARRLMMSGLGDRQAVPV